MFSYRHAFHAGNHADVLKHTALVAVLRYLTQKPTPLSFIDTHAGAGLYRLNSRYASTSAEAEHGVVPLVQALQNPGPHKPVAPALSNYVSVLQQLNPKGVLRLYPGSPVIARQLLRAQDPVKLLELHPTDGKLLARLVARWANGQHTAVLRADGFEGLKQFLPPPSRRALVLCDPSYEIKSDYERVVNTLADALKRFATGCYMIWHPIIARPEAHDLPRRLKTLSTKAARPWLHASLTVKSNKVSGTGAVQHGGLPASGLFVINPPHTLHGALAAALPQLVEHLAQDRNAGFTLITG